MIGVVAELIENQERCHKYQYGGSEIRPLFQRPSASGRISVKPSSTQIEKIASILDSLMG
jgi:hypothetical protein